MICGRVVLNKQKLLEQSDLDQEMVYEELRRKKVAQDQTMERVKAQLVVGVLLHIGVCRQATESFRAAPIFTEINVSLNPIGGRRELYK